MPDGNKLRVAIDTNLLISASLVTDSLPDKLIRSWLNKEFILLISLEQLEEIKNVSQRKKLRTRPLFTKRITELIEDIEYVAETLKPLPKKDLPLHGRDEEDDFMIAAALGGDVDYLITGDEDLLVLNDNPAMGKLKIISVRDFLKIL